MSATSSQYAVALFELAHEKNQLEEIENTFQALVNAIGSEELAFFKHPKVLKKDKKDVIKGMKLNDLLTDFLFVLIDNNRFEHVELMYKDFEQLILEQGKKMRINLFSKERLDSKRMSQLKEQFEKKYNRQVIIENHVDSSIIGGLRIEYDGKVLDDTINQTLRQLKNRLTK